MSLIFDHLVHYVRDPNEAIRLSREIGLHAVEGGRHERRGTHNALCHFDLSYIEWIGIYDRHLADQNRVPHSVLHTISRASFREGLVRVALRTDRIDEDAEHYVKLGFEVIGPVDASRRRLDGSVVRWKQLYLAHPDQPFALPFLIQWEDREARRREDLTARNVISPHPSGVTAISCVAFAVRDLEIALAWSRWFGLPMEEAGTDGSLQARCRTLRLPGGNLRFCRPEGTGVVSGVLAERGEGPFLVGLSGGSKQGEAHLFGGLYRFNM
jgi:hypothetical protein